MNAPQYDSRKAEVIMKAVASALRRDWKDYYFKTRLEHISHFRFVAFHLLRRYVQYITLKQVAALMKLIDHTTIINGLNRADDFIETGDSKFLALYTPAEERAQKELLRAGYTLEEYTPKRYRKKDNSDCMVHYSHVMR